MNVDTPNRVTSSNTIEVRPCRDEALIDSVMLELAPYLSTDQYPGTFPARVLLARPEFLFLGVYIAGVARGLVMLIGNEVHTMFLPSLRGAAAIRAGREVLRWIWSNTGHRVVTSYAYSHRPEVMLFARIMGFRPNGILDDGSTIGGVPTYRTNLLLEKP